MKSVPDCTHCGATPWDCECGDANEPNGFTSKGYPVNRDGFIAMDRCTSAQRLEIYEDLLPRMDFTRRQFG